MTFPPIKLNTPGLRERAKGFIDAAPDGWVSWVKEATRNLDQNARMWAMLFDVARQCELAGGKYTPDSWKVVFMKEAGWDSAFLPDFGGSFFPTGFKSSRLTVGQMSELIQSIQVYGDEQGVKWSEPEPGDTR